MFKNVEQIIIEAKHHTVHFALNMNMMNALNVKRQIKKMSANN